MRRRFRTLGLVACLGVLAGCGRGAGGGGGGPSGGAGAESPAAATQTPEGPVGLYFMTRYLQGAGLEKKVWYFAPDGRVFEGLTTGFSDEDLKAHEGRRGTRKRDGARMTITWADGTTSPGSFEPDEEAPPTFTWDMGIFVPAKPFDDRSVAGSYEGGESITGVSGRAAVGHALELRADGTFTRGSAATVSSSTDQGTASAGAAGPATEGTWKASGWSLHLTSKDGRVERKIAFPYDDEETPAYPDHLFVGGTMFRRR